LSLGTNKPFPHTDEPFQSANKPFPTTNAALPSSDKPSGVVAAVPGGTPVVRAVLGSTPHAPTKTTPTLKTSHFAHFRAKTTPISLANSPIFQKEPNFFQKSSGV
jgi:hypothetical protein